MGAGHGGNPWRATQLLALALAVLFATGVLLERVRPGAGGAPPQGPTRLPVARSSPSASVR